MTLHWAILDKPSTKRTWAHLGNVNTDHVSDGVETSITNTVMYDRHYNLGYVRTWSYFWRDRFEKFRGIMS